MPAQLARRGLAAWLADDQPVAGLLGVEDPGARQQQP
jgi:hypothetical protein